MHGPPPSSFRSVMRRRARLVEGAASGGALRGKCLPRAQEVDPGLRRDDGWGELPGDGSPR
ncbi:hypothetical protein C725_2281 [Pacificimonas flava]|uniref:Uncharacterized protein n=1 Tax=Pacificimonas flava TaxID=1234595 RepID=M2U2Z1_9SPHN|nr:hypothetical protein C725_2281 [Pacificimonas flava]